MHSSIFVSCGEQYEDVVHHQVPSIINLCRLMFWWQVWSCKESQMLLLSNQPLKGSSTGNSPEFCWICFLYPWSEQPIKIKSIIIFYRRVCVWNASHVLFISLSASTYCFSNFLKTMCILDYFLLCLRLSSVTKFFFFKRKSNWLIIKEKINYFTQLGIVFN